jgi:hypothetical protein
VGPPPTILRSLPRTNAWSVVGCILQGAAQNIGMFIAARFIIVSLVAYMDGMSGGADEV